MDKEATHQMGALIILKGICVISLQVCTGKFTSAYFASPPFVLMHRLVGSAHDGLQGGSVNRAFCNAVSRHISSIKPRKVLDDLTIQQLPQIFNM